MALAQDVQAILAGQGDGLDGRALEGREVTRRAVNAVATTSRDFSNHVVPTLVLVVSPSITGECRARWSPFSIRSKALVASVGFYPADPAVQERACQSLTALAALRAR